MWTRGSRHRRAMRADPGRHISSIHDAAIPSPHCGQLFAQRSARQVSGTVKVAVAALLALLLLGGAGAAVAIHLHNEDVRSARSRREAVAAAHEREALSQAASAKLAAEQSKISERQQLESALESAISKDAKEQVGKELLTGPILSTTCTPINGGSSQDLAQTTGTYTCLAVNEKKSGGAEAGYTYTGTINFVTGNYTWKLGGR